MTKVKAMLAARRFAFAFVAMLALLFGASAHAQATDITGVISALSGYYTAAAAVGILVLLFVLGRTIVRKIAK